MANSGNQLFGILVRLNQGGEHHVLRGQLAKRFLDSLLERFFGHEGLLVRFWVVGIQSLALGGPRFA